MDLIIATLALAFCQDPPPSAKPEPAPRATAGQTGPPEEQAAPKSRDVITIDGGEQIVGTIVKEVGNYIEVQVDEHTVVGFERSRIRRIEAAPDTPARRAALAAREDWFLLHDSRGQSAGYMHALIQPDGAGGVRVSEEWCFTTGSGHTQVTMLDTLGHDLEPRSTFYHERVISKRDRLVSERLRTGTVEEGKLVVQERSLKGSQRHEYPFDQRIQFPLSYRARLRQASGTQVVAANQELFDPRTGEFLVWRASSIARRRIQLHGKELYVREITLDNGNGSNSEWIDANHHVVRREVNGASLVAVRVDEATARRSGKQPGPTGFGSAIAATASGDMALWLPNPVWTNGSQDASRVSIKAPLYQATATLMVLDQIPANVLLASAADLMVRWLKLTNNSRVVSREGVQLMRSPAIRLTVKWSVDREGESVTWQGICHVFRVGDRYATLFCSAPLDNFRQLGFDFDRILESVQLDPQDIAPELQGPKAKARR